MSTEHPSEHAPSAPQGPSLGLAIRLSLLLLIISAFTFLESLVFMFDRHQILKGFEWWPLLMSPTGRILAGFLVFVLGMHVLLGVLTWWIARAWQRQRGADARAARSALLLAWLIWAAALLFANAGLSPWSDSARYLRDLAGAGLGPVRIWHLIVALAVATLLPVLIELVQRLRACAPRRQRQVALTALLLLAVVPMVSAWQSLASHGGSGDGRPNIIIIGVDSLRLPWVGAFGGEDTPHIDRFVAEAALFEWSFTPLGRTFASWMSLLTGQNPRTNGVRENVMPEAAYAGKPTLADELRAAGWRTVYATDEVRFAPIDEAMGFEQTIGPPIGAHDFVIATIADLPISNVFANTLLGRWFMPAVHGNRAAAVSYEPESFDTMIWRDLESDDRPVFLSVHFTLPHHPIYWGSASRMVSYIPREGIPARMLMNESLMRAATREADAQVGRFLAEAERRGLLENAIVVLMSDHGEATGLPEEDSLQILHSPEGIAGLKFANSLVGHGNSTTSSRQFETLLAFRRYGGGEEWRGRRSLQASLVDVAPTLLGLVGAAHLGPKEGLDLTPLLRRETVPDDYASRLLYTETGFSPFSLRNEPDVDERRVFLESIFYYQVDYGRGRINFNPEQLPFLLSMKERAVIATPWVLAAVPSLQVEQTLWILYNLKTGDWVRYPQDLHLLPGSPPAAYMEASLLAHYAEELSPPEPWPESLTVRVGSPEAKRQGYVLVKPPVSP